MLRVKENKAAYLRWMNVIDETDHENKQNVFVMTWLMIKIESNATILTECLVFCWFDRFNRIRFTIHHITFNGFLLAIHTIDNISIHRRLFRIFVYNIISITKLPNRMHFVGWENLKKTNEM